MEVKAPAKVNWHLAVGPRRPDGYHPILSVFQTCSLCDILDIEIGEGPFSVTVTGLEEYCESGNSTIDKAARLWHECTGFDKSLRVGVTKKIPVQAGLGGGSSDAASVLMYLNSLSDCPMTREALMEFGSQVGCDVPFFIAQERAAIVTSLGEQVRPIRARDLKGFIIVMEGQKVSTREAYGAMDRRKEIPPFEREEDIEKTYRLPVSQWDFRNDFLLVNRVPDIDVLDGEKLLLTGSGSCFVLLTKREKLTLKDGMKAIRVSF